MFIGGHSGEWGGCSLRPPEWSLAAQEWPILELSQAILGKISSATFLMYWFQNDTSFCMNGPF